MSEVTFHKVRGDKRLDLCRKYGRSVQVNRQKYKIMWCQALTRNNERVEGVCDPGDRILYIDVDSFDLEATLLHEIFHAEFAEGGFRQRTNWDMDLEEQIVESLALSMAHNFQIKPRGKK